MIHTGHPPEIRAGDFRPVGLHGLDAGLNYILEDGPGQWQHHLLREAGLAVRFELPDRND